MKTLIRCFTEVIEILKTGLYKLSYHCIKGQKVWKKEHTTIFIFFYYK